MAPVTSVLAIAIVMLAPCVFSAQSASIDNALLSNIIQTALVKMNAAPVRDQEEPQVPNKWDVDLTGHTDWFQKFFCCDHPAVSTTSLPVEVIDTRYDTDPNAALVYGSYTCTTPGVVDSGNACTYSFSTSKANSAQWTNSKTEGFSVGLKAQFGASIPLVGESKVTASAEFNFANTDEHGEGTVTTDQATATCNIPSVAGDGSCFQCVMLYQQAVPTITVRARARLSGWVGIHSEWCSNPNELMKYFPDARPGGDCHFYRVMSIADLMDLAVRMGVILESDYEIDRSSGTVDMTTIITVKARAGYQFESTVAPCSTPVPAPGTVLSPEAFKSLTGRDKGAGFAAIVTGGGDSLLAGGIAAAGCGWEGHCAGDACTGDEDCDGELSCEAGKCSGGASADGGSGSDSLSTGGGAAGCGWAGHCLGDVCSSGDDCDGDLSCEAGKCSGSSGAGGGAGGGSSGSDSLTTGGGAAACGWAGHCAGDVCSSGDDCDGELSCESGKCSGSSGAGGAAGGGSSGSDSLTTGGGAAACGWADHCAGDVCSSGDDCDGELSCESGKCSGSSGAGGAAGGGSSGSDSLTTAGGAAAGCGWAGHCLGDVCSSGDDCDGELSCESGKCSGSSGAGGAAGGGSSGSDSLTTAGGAAAGCGWAGHCLGDVCSSGDDCDGELSCQAGRCASGGGNRKFLRAK